jgi:putative inorganic carbon (HCO3(-)) transporter
MRDLLIFAAVFGLLPFIFKRPAIGVLMFAWISLMNPHRLAYGAAYDFPFAAVIAAVTLLALVIAYRSRRFPLTLLTGMLLIFIFWTTLTSFTAINPDLSWKEWTRVMKTMFMAIVAMYVLTEKKDLNALAWVVALSLAFYGVKGGLFTILSGGKSHVLGPEGSYITDNNALALALVMTLPLLWYLRMHAPRKWMRVSMTVAALLTVISAAGSYSRGALLAGGAMLFFLWLKSHQKVRTGFGLLLLVPVIFLVMPEQWFSRMNSIQDYQGDSSALGRINAWYFAVNVATSRFMGGGFDIFTRDMFFQFAPEPLNYHVAHSIYFQVLGEHGFVGLALFVLLLLCAWRSGSRTIKACKGDSDMKWASDLAAMTQVSLIGYVVGGAFLSLAYYDLYYNLIAVLVVLEKIIGDRKPVAAFANRDVTELSYQAHKT